jgi:hypothetical protein
LTDSSTVITGKSPWYDDQSWQACGQTWHFRYVEFGARRTIENGDGTIVLSVSVKDTTRFPSPQAWLDRWAKTKGKKRLAPVQETAVTPELDFSGKSEPPKQVKSQNPKLIEPPPEPLAVEVVSDELTPEDERDRLFLERKVERAFYEAGKALRELRDRRLYRSTHATFEEYVQDRFGMKQSRSYQLIDATRVVDNLSAKVPPMVEVLGDSSEKVPPMVEVLGDSSEKVSPMVEVLGDSSEKVPPMVEVLPTNERQVRPLIQLEPEQQRQVWQQAVEEAGGKVPSGRAVKDIVQRVRERMRVPIPYRVGDVCEILVRDNPELRGLGGCWCVVTDVREFSCLVRAWNGEYVVREENLKDLGYFPDQREAVKQLSDRLTGLQSLRGEETAAAILEALGKLKRPYLNPWEEKLLEFLERWNSTR